MRTSSVLFLLALVGCNHVAVHQPAPAPSSAPGTSEAAGFTNPIGRREWHALRWRDERGNLPTGAHRAAARAQAAANDAHWDQLDDGNLTRTAWVARGPDNIGGRTRCLVIHPTRPWRLWCGAVGGGVWRSDTFGNNWEKLADFPGNLAIGCLALDPANADVIYAGTGEGFGNIDAISGEGIWKSTDGGDTWSQLLATAAFGNTNRIAVGPLNGSIVLASTSTGLRRSTNGGTTWTTVVAGNSLQVLFDPNDGNRCVATVTVAGVASVRRSTDAGATWTNSTYANGGGRVELAYAKATANRMFAAVDQAGGQLWRSNDGGNVWTQMAAAGIAPAGGQVWYDNSLWVDPTDSNRIVVGWTSIWRSTDGGATGTIVASGGGFVIDEDLPHADVHAVVADPRYDGATNKTVYVCTDGGVYRTEDITTCTTTSGWSQRKTGFQTSQYYGVAGHGSGRLVGGMQDNGTAAITTADPLAQRLIGGDGGPCAIDPTDPTKVFGQTQFRSVWRHDGTSETFIGSGSGEIGQGNCNNFISPIALDPHDRQRLYSGGCSLWRTSNANAAAPTWTAIKPSTGTPISAIAISPGSANVVWVGHNDGTVFRTTNATAASPTWTTVDDNAGVNPLPNRYVSAILIDRLNVNKVFVCLGGFSAGNVQRTTNNGTSFASASGGGATGLPNAPMFSIAQHPILAGHYYVASEVGVFDTLDDCANWSTTNEGPADVSCNELTFIPGTTTLLLGTHGRGLWTAELPAPGARNLGVGCAGSNGTPFLSSTPPQIGQACTVSLNGTVFNQPAFLLQGTSRFSWLGNLLPFDMAPFGAAGCELRVAPDIVRELTLAAQGTIVMLMPIGSSPALVGQQFYLQAVVVDPAANAWGNTLSNAVHMTIGP